MRHFKYIIFVYFFIAVKPMIGSEQLIDSATNAFSNANYQLAEKYYLEVLKSNIFSAELYYNLGNTYYKQGDLGRSILMFEKALYLNPKFEDAQYNFNLANSKLVDTFNSQPTFNSETVFIGLNKVISSNTIAIISLLLILGSLGFLVYSKLFNKSPSKTIVLLILGVGLLLFFLSSYQTSVLNNIKEAVILKNEVKVYSEPTQNATILFVLHEGTKVKVLSDSNPENLEIQTPDNHKGWINKNGAGIIQVLE